MSGRLRASTDAAADNAKIYADIGMRIRELRKKRGLTQHDLAGAVRLTRASIANVESGRQKLLVHSLFELAQALEVAPIDLLPRLITKTPDHDLERLVTDYNGPGRSWIRSIAQSQSKGH